MTRYGSSRSCNPGNWSCASRRLAAPSREVCHWCLPRSLPLCRWWSATHQVCGRPQEIGPAHQRLAAGRHLHTRSRACAPADHDEALRNTSRERAEPENDRPLFSRQQQEHQPSQAKPLRLLANPPCAGGSRFSCQLQLCRPRAQHRRAPLSSGAEPDSETKRRTLRGAAAIGRAATEERIARAISKGSRVGGCEGGEGRRECGFQGRPWQGKAAPGVCAALRAPPPHDKTLVWARRSAPGKGGWLRLLDRSKNGGING